MIQRLGDVIQLSIVHVRKGTLHVADEPAYSMSRHSLTTPRGRFSWVAAHVIVPGTNPWTSSAHRPVPLVCQWHPLPGRVSCTALPPHALRPGRPQVSWEAAPVSTGTGLSSSSPALTPCFTCGFRAITLNFHLPGRFCNFRVVSRRFSEICGTGGGSLA